MLLRWTRSKPLVAGWQAPDEHMQRSQHVNVKMIKKGKRSNYLCARLAQAEDRAHRIGQKRDVLVLVLVAAGTIEQAILEKAKAKRDIDAKVIQVRGKLVLFYSMQ